MIRKKYFDNNTKPENIPWNFYEDRELVILEILCDTNSKLSKVGGLEIYIVHKYTVNKNN